MAVTYLSNLVNPEVMAGIINATLPKKIKFANIAKIDTTLQGRAGDTITVPKYAYIGDAEDVAEGVSLGTTVLTTSTTQVTVKKAGKAIEITDEAILSGYGDPVGEGSNQLSMSIASKIDNDCLNALLGASLAYDGSSAKIGYSGIVNAVDIFEDENDSPVTKVMFVHPKQITHIRLDADFKDINKYPLATMMTGTIGAISGVQIVPAKRVPLIKYEVGGSSDTAVTSSNQSTYAGCTWDATNKEIITPAVDTYVKAVTNQYYLNPIVVVDTRDTNEATTADAFALENPAITIYMKRGVQLETDRDILASTNVIKADEHYGAVLSNESKVVLAKFKSA